MVDPELEALRSFYGQWDKKIFHLNDDFTITLDEIIAIVAFSIKSLRETKARLEELRREHQ